MLDKAGASHWRRQALTSKCKHLEKCGSMWSAREIVRDSVAQPLAVALAVLARNSSISKAAAEEAVCTNYTH